MKKNELEKQDLEPFYCTRCKRFLGMAYIIEGTIMIKCPRCKIFNILDNPHKPDYKKKLLDK